ncbi:hypothetical protein [Granulicella sp. dw_53]|uniref:hypothetical protein n=1 Tax=Granulicella sp. dw_53 TaxID=2719792 RepID=UPI001BD539B3|nr:hypothetical protein [Granulicella sp. dw_53]
MNEMNKQSIHEASPKTILKLTPDRFYNCLLWISGVLLILSFVLGVGAIYWGNNCPLKEIPVKEWPWYRQVEVAVLVSWVVLPPLFFWFEFQGIYRQGRRRPFYPGTTEVSDWELFKYTQDVSAKVWLAVTTALLVLYFGKDLKI